MEVRLGEMARRIAALRASPLPPEAIGSLRRWFRFHHVYHSSAIAHTWLVSIHPFVDGNGRTTRLLANLIPLQSGYPIVVLRGD